MTAYKFTCIAASYGFQGTLLPKGFQITLKEADPRISLFRNNRAFKEEAVNDFQEPAIVTLSLPKRKERGIPLESLAIKKNVVEALAGAGLSTAESVIERGKDALTDIPGIAEKTAESVYAACEEAILAGAAPKPKEPGDEIDG